jgi:hypothetical protein
MDTEIGTIIASDSVTGPDSNLVAISFEAVGIEGI